MSLLSPPSDGTAAQQLADKLKLDIRRAFMQMRQVFQFTVQNVWNNANISPEDVIAAFGTDATELFAMSNQMIDMMNTFAGAGITQIVPDGFTYTLHEDGSVTIARVSSSSSSSGGDSSSSSSGS